MKFIGWKSVVILVFFFLFSVTSSDAYAAIAGGINIGPNYGEMETAANAIGPDGWIYVLGCPGDLAKIEAEFNKISPSHPGIKLMVRAFLRGGSVATTETALKMADDWGKAFNAMDTPSKIYFVPANEVNNPVEGFIDPESGQFTNLEGLHTYLDELKKVLPGNKVVQLSPTIDTFFLSDHIAAQIDAISSLNFASYDGFAVSQYGQYRGGVIDTTAPGVKRGQFTDLQNQPFGLTLPNDVYIVETGVITAEAGHVEYANNASLITDFLTKMNQGLWSQGRVKAAIIFSYNPDGNYDLGWIYQHGEVISALKALQTPLATIPLTRPNGDKSINLSEINASCANAVINNEIPQIVKKGDDNVAQNLNLTILAYLQAGAILNESAQVQMAISNILPNGNGVIPDFDREQQVMDSALQPLLPSKFTQIKGAGNPVPDGKTGVIIDVTPAPVTMTGTMYVNTFQGDGTPNTQSLDGTTLLYPTQNSTWAKPLRSYNTTYDAMFSHSSNTYQAPLKPQNYGAEEKINLVQPKKILELQHVPEDANGSGQAMKEKIETPSNEIDFNQLDANISFEVKLVAAILQFFNLVNVADPEAVNQAQGAIQAKFVSRNHISDFTRQEDKQPGQDYLQAQLPKVLQPNYADNSQHLNPVTGPGDIQKIDLVSNSAKGMKDAYHDYYCGTLLSGLSKERTTEGCAVRPTTTPGPDIAGLYKMPTLPTECTLQPETVDRLAKRIGNGQGEFAGYFYGQGPGTLGEQILRDYWGAIQDAAVSHQLNPILAFIFLTEESGIGGFPNAALVGCNFERGTGIPSPKGFSAANLNQQMACLSNYMKDIPNFDSFLCVYAGEKQPDGSYQCNGVFKNNPNFVPMLRWWRDEILKGLPSAPAQCRVPELDKYAPPAGL